jgi:hypothetical protein
MPYCKQCRRFLNISKFYEREDRPGFYAFCRKCMKKTPLFANIYVHPNWIKVLDREERTREYPENRGYGVIR